MRALLDTNVLIAGFITRGTCRELLEHCLRQHTIIASEFILIEFNEHLVGKFQYTSEETSQAPPSTARLLRLELMSSQ